MDNVIKFLKEKSLTHEKTLDPFGFNDVILRDFRAAGLEDDIANDFINYFNPIVETFSMPIPYPVIPRDSAFLVAIDDQLNIAISTVQKHIGKLVGERYRRELEIFISERFPPGN